MTPADSAGREPSGARSQRRWRRAAQAAIMVEFAALVRIVAEYFRLRHVAADTFSLANADVWLTGVSIAAAAAWISVVLYFLHRDRWVVAVAVAMVAALVAVKIYGVQTGLI